MFEELPDTCPVDDSYNGYAQINFSRALALYEYYVIKQTTLLRNLSSCFPVHVCCMSKTRLRVNRANHVFRANTHTRRTDSLLTDSPQSERMLWFEQFIYVNLKSVQLCGMKSAFKCSTATCTSKFSKIRLYPVLILELS